MAEKSTAVKHVVDYDVPHADGSSTRVREVAFVDPDVPDVLHIHRDVWVQKPIEFINIEIHQVNAED